MEALKIVLTLLAVFATARSFDLHTKDKKIQGRIIHGHPATDLQLPYVVYIDITLNTGFLKLCAGSLIGYEWVLSAAHCFHDIQAVIIYVGMTGFDTALGAYHVEMENIYRHDNWECNRNDIALVKLPPNDICNFIQPIMLPKLGEDFSYAGSTAIISGWGEMDEEGSLPSRLQWGVVRIMSNTHCKLLYYHDLTSEKLCAFSRTGVTSAAGDSGGPLVLQDSNILVGVLSCRLIQENVLFPAIYMSVRHYLPWIKEVTGISY